jgi:pyruvate/2-oxoglutarate dehydrogenase complex dihydrolipoamide dehydrogenase (E3) component
VIGKAGGGRVLGVTIVAAPAGEMIHEPALAIHARLFTGRLAQGHPRLPTWSLAVQRPLGLERDVARR